MTDALRNRVRHGWTAVLERARAWRLGEIVAPLLVMAAGVYLYAPLLWGDLPLNHDHPVLVLRAWILGQHIASHGSPYGFSPILFAGNPVDGMYAVGADLLVGFFRVVSLGLAGWETAYCWALLVAVLAYPGALYALGRRVAGPFAGLVAGLLGLVDRGAYLQSGWDFTLNWGVWAMGLSFSLCLWTFWALDRLIERPSRGRLATLAMLSGGALVGHPMAIAILGVVIPLQITWTAASRGFRTALQWLPSVLTGFAIGGGLAAFWYVPFIAHGEWFEPLGLEWRAFPEVITGLLDGTLLDTFAPAFVLLGAVGLLWAALRRNVLAATLLLATGLLLYVSSNSFLLAFDVLKKLPGVANLQMERFSYVVRAALLLGTGVCAGLLVREARQAAKVRPDSDRSGRFARGLRVLLAALVLLPFLVQALTQERCDYVVPAKRMEYASQDARYQSLLQAADALKALAPAEVGRVAVNASRHEHLLMLLPLYTGLPVFKLGFTPENNYRFRPESADPAFQAALGISHVLSIDPMPRDNLQEINRFGSLRLYRVKDFRPQRVVVHGPGTAEVLRDDPEDLDIRLAGTGPGSQVEVRVGRFALWTAAIEGDPVEIQGATVGDSPPMFMRIAARDGLLTLRYRAGPAEWIGGLTTLLALLGLAFLGVLLSSRRLRARWEQATLPWRTGLARVVCLGVAGVAAIAVIAVGVLLLSPGRQPMPGREVVSDLSTRLPSGRAEVLRDGGVAPCGPWEARRFQCSTETWNYVGPTILTAGGLIRQCIWMHPAPDGTLTLRLPDSPLGDRLEGHFGLSDAAALTQGGAEVHLTVQVDGQPAREFTCPPRPGWNAWSVETPGRDGTTGNVTVSVRTNNPAQRHFCVTVLSTRDAGPARSR